MSRMVSGLITTGSNGINDVGIATIRSWHMTQTIPNFQLIVSTDAGHGAQVQGPERSLKHAVQFMEE